MGIDVTPRLQRSLVANQVSVPEREHQARKG